MGDIIEEGMVQLKISEYDEIALIYPKLEELTREPLYLKSNTKHVHAQSACFNSTLPL